MRNINISSLLSRVLLQILHSVEFEDTDRTCWVSPSVSLEIDSVVFTVLCGKEPLEETASASITVEITKRT